MSTDAHANSRAVNPVGEGVDSRAFPDYEDGSDLKWGPSPGRSVSRVHISQQRRERSNMHRQGERRGRGELRWGVAHCDTCGAASLEVPMSPSLCQSSDGDSLPRYVVPTLSLSSRVWWSWWELALFRASDRRPLMRPAIGDWIVGEARLSWKHEHSQAIFSPLRGGFGRHSYLLRCRR